jgi:regulatory protein
MDRRITDLSVQKRNKDRVNVYLDGQFAFGLPAAVAAGLKVGQVISEEEVVRLRQKDAVQRAVDYGLNLLSYRARSRSEIARRLRRKGYEDAAIEEAIARLTRAELLDDEAFARYWVDNRFRFNPRGEAMLRQELRQKGVKDQVIDTALEDYDEEDAAARAAETAIHRWRRLDPADLRGKLYNYLRRRGFPYALIEPVLERALVGHPPEESLDQRNEE